MAPEIEHDRIRNAPNLPRQRAERRLLQSGQRVPLHLFSETPHLPTPKGVEPRPEVKETG